MILFAFLPYHVHYALHRSFGLCLFVCLFLPSICFSCVNFPAFVQRLDYCVLFFCAHFLAFPFFLFFFSLMSHCMILLFLGILFDLIDPDVYCARDPVIYTFSFLHLSSSITVLSVHLFLINPFPVKAFVHIYFSSFFRSVYFFGIAVVFSFIFHGCSIKLYAFSFHSSIFILLLISFTSFPLQGKGRSSRWQNIRIKKTSKERPYQHLFIFTFIYLSIFISLHVCVSPSISLLHQSIKITRKNIYQ